MNKFARIVQAVFGVPWLVFGAQHFLYVDFVAKLVPAYFPAQWFWVYLTGAAMIAAGISFIVNRKSALAAASLGLMLLIFILLLHTSTIAKDSSNVINWTRTLQDLAIAASAFMLTGILTRRENEPAVLKKIGKLSRYVFAVLLIVFGVEQFFNLDFLTAKVPEYFLLRIFSVYLTGIAMIVTGATVFINKKARTAAIALGTFLLILNVLRYAPLFIGGAYSALLLTAAMLDLAITCGVFVLACDLSGEENLGDENQFRVTKMVNDSKVGTYFGEKLYEQKF